METLKAPFDLIQENEATLAVELAWKAEPLHCLYYYPADDLKWYLLISGGSRNKNTVAHQSSFVELIPGVDWSSWSSEPLRTYSFPCAGSSRSPSDRSCHTNPFLYLLHGVVSSSI
jgi:hypothetical protein